MPSSPTLSYSSPSGPPTSTVVATATAAGESAIAIVRLTGPDCGRLVQELFEIAPPPPRQMMRGTYRSQDGRVLDDLLWVYFAGPASYTGEDVLELHLHGNPYLVSRVLADLQARGAAPAAPGEFTRRAFLNGRLDLSQAEAVSDLIRARSDRALAAAQAQLSGSVGRAVDALSDRLTTALAGLEAYLDFPEEDLPPEQAAGPWAELVALARSCRELAATAPSRERLRDGVRIALVGQPNAGKSSLLNALVGDDRALVDADPGTTRDWLEAPMVEKGILVRLIDTAGLRQAEGRVEAAGVARSQAVAAAADLRVWVVDGSRPAPESPMTGSGEVALVVLTKNDLSTHATFSDWAPEKPKMSISSISGDGLSALRTELARRAALLVPGEGADLLVSARHAAALAEAAERLEAAVAVLEKGEPPELAAIEARLAWEALGQITGRTDPERILDRLFSGFCIGK